MQNLGSQAIPCFKTSLLILCSQCVDGSDRRDQALLLAAILLDVKGDFLKEASDVRRALEVVRATLDQNGKDFKDADFNFNPLVRTEDL